jgi:electron transfer flavoprotein beta subunit
MEIIVLVKQVPDTTEVKIDPKKGTLIREGVESIMNPDDAVAMEFAVRLKQRHKNVGITAISMGPPQAKEVLQEAIGMGADTGILLTDIAFAGADTLATSYALGQCIKYLGNYDLVIAGRQAIDGDTAQIGPQVAEYLGIPQITYVDKVKITRKRVKARRRLEDGYQNIIAPLPALVTVIQGRKSPRYPTMGGLIEACGPDADIRKWDAADIKAHADMIGMKGSPTWVVKTFSPKSERKCELLKGGKKDVAKELMQKLEKKGLLRGG